MNRPRIPDYDVETKFDWEYVFELNRYIEYLERQIKIDSLETLGNNEVTLCGCIDNCSSKRDEYYCRAKRPCIHKIVK